MVYKAAATAGFIGLKKGLPKAKDKIKDLFKKRKAKKADGKGGTGKAVAAGGGAGVTSGLGSAYLGSKLAGGPDQGDTIVETGAGAGPGALFGATPTGMMSGLGLAGGLMGGGGGVQVAPETVSLAPGKSVFEQILGVLITIKQDTMSLVSSFNSASESQGRALESAQAAQAEAKTESKRGSLAGGIKGAATTVTSGVKKGLGFLGKALTGLFAADVANKLLGGKGFFAKDAEAAESVPVGEDGEPVLQEKGFFQEMKDKLKPATNNFVEGLKQVLFAGTPGEFENASAFEGLQKLMKGIGGLFDNLLNPITFLEEMFPETFGGGKLDALKLENIMGYFFGKPGENSPFAEDLGNIADRVKEAFKYEGSPLEADINKAKDFFTNLGTNIAEKSSQFIEDAKNMRDDIFASISETFKKIKEFFTDKVPEFFGFGPDKPLTETEQQQKQIEEITGDDATKDQREKVIEELTKSGQIKKESLFEGVGNKEYEDLDPSTKAFVDREVEFQQKKMLKEQKLEAPVNKNIVPEKDQEANALGAKMISGTVNPITLLPLTQNSGGTTNNIVNNNDNSSKSTSVQNVKGGGGNIGTTNGDVSLYANHLVPSFMQGNRN